MKNYENVKIELFLFANEDVLTSSLDEMPILPKKGEGLWKDFYS